MGIFSDAAAADTTSVITRKPRARPGKYVVKVIEVKLVDERGGDKSILVEYEVLQSNNDATPVGQICAWFQRLTGKSRDMGPGIYKRFVAVCAGLDPDDAATNTQIGEAELEAAIADDQPFAGVLLDMEAVASGKLDDNGDPYTNCWFSNAREAA